MIILDELKDMYSQVNIEISSEPTGVSKDNLLRLKFDILIKIKDIED